MNGPAKFKKKAKFPTPNQWNTSPQQGKFPTPNQWSGGPKPATNIMSGFKPSATTGVTTGPEQPFAPKAKQAPSIMGIGPTVSPGTTDPTIPTDPDKPPFDPTTIPGDYTPEGYDVGIQDSTADLLQKLKDQGYFESLGIL